MIKSGVENVDMNGPPTSLRTVHALPQSQLGSVFSSQTNTYKIKRLIQTAIYGGVFECHMFTGKNPQNHQNVAIKIMLKDLERKHRGKLQENIRAELNFQHEMKGHKNLLSYIETWTDSQAVYIVMPLAEHEDLFEVLKKRETAFTERECRWLFSQLLDGAHYLHTRGVAFRDYSVENVLMFQDPDGTVFPRIADPGQAINVQYNKNGDVKGLLAERLFGKCFRPPEIYIKRPYNPVKVDTFCLGWMLFYCLTKRQIFDKATNADANWVLLKSGRIRELLEAHNALPLSITVIDLLIRMMHPDFERWRYTPKQALGHPWFKGRHVSVNKNTIYKSGSIPDRIVPQPSVKAPIPNVPSHKAHKVPVISSNRLTQIHHQNQSHPSVQHQTTSQHVSVLGRPKNNEGSNINATEDDRVKEKYGKSYIGPAGGGNVAPLTFNDVQRGAYKVV